MARSKAQARKPKTRKAKANKGVGVSADESPGPGGRRPVSKSVRADSRLARAALSSGALASDVEERRKQRDRRTLYVRFKGARETWPADEDHIAKMHPDIKQVRVLRHGNKKKKDKDGDRRVKFCFVEFADESACESAHRQLQASEFNGGQIYVDFVGQKARVKVKRPERPASKKRMPVNPCRLLVSGLPKGYAGDEQKLKKLFPKCTKASIPSRSLEKSGGSYGFVQFSSPADAKAAFDGAGDGLVLPPGDAKVTVVFAKLEKRQVGVGGSGKTNGGRGKEV